MTYQIVQIKNNVEDFMSKDLYICNIVTGKEVIAKGVRIWDEDQYSLAYMFKLVETGKWEEGMLSDEDEADLMKEFNVKDSDDIETWNDCHRQGLYE